MKKILYIPNKFLIFALIAGLLCLITGAFLDLQLSNTLYQPGTLFEMIGYCYGPLPLFWCFDFFACSCIELGLTRKNWIRPAGIAAGASIFAFGLIYIIGHAIPYYSNQLLNAFISTLLSVYVPITIYRRQRAKNSFSVVFKRSLFAALIAVSTYLVVHVLKIVFLRPRYRYLITDANIAFQPWYLRLGQLVPEGIKSDEFYSFPSGHAATSSTILVFAFFYKKPVQTRILVFGVVWILLTVLSRIVAGAHFLSDVSAGFTITILILIIGPKIFYLLQKPETP